MKFALSLALTAFSAFAVHAADPRDRPGTMTPAAPAPEEVIETPPEALDVLEVFDAEGLDPADFLWESRIVVIFADTPADPLFQQQLRMLDRSYPGLRDRDVVVVVDTNPEGRSLIRQQLRPRGFSLVLVDKDGMVKQRKPNPWTAREIFHAIDRLPLRRQEVLEERPGRHTN